jgi:hypothetical protein
MPRYYPDSDNDFYAESVINCHENTPPLLIRRNPLLNPIQWYREPDHADKNRSEICSWGFGKTFQGNTGLECDYFIKSRIRKNCKLPIAGRSGMWKITRTGPGGMLKLTLHEWKLSDWIETERRLIVKKSSVIIKESKNKSKKKAKGTSTMKAKNNKK